MHIYVITGLLTSDYPGVYTVRRHHYNGDRSVIIDIEPIGHAKTLEEARKLVPPYLSQFARDPNDDPVIIEYWM